MQSAFSLFTLDDEHYWLYLQGIPDENRVIPTGVYYSMNSLLVQLFTYGPTLRPSVTK